MTAGDGLTFLDEWHVALFAPADLDDAQAEAAREQLGDSLQRWASSRQTANDRCVVVVDQ